MDWLNVYNYFSLYSNLSKAKIEQHDRQIRIVEQLVAAPQGKCADTMTEFLLVFHHSMLNDGKRLLNTRLNELYDASLTSIAQRELLLLQLERGISSNQVCENLPLITKQLQAENSKYK
jgi:hypothetical protein